ncbi:MAG: hypothetical protein ACOX5A_02530 [Aminivibrio sp.]|jgi:hypothetical protein|nr:hypothetical protein [Synergistaceae bacterium]
MKRLNGKVFAAVMVAVLLAAGSAFAWGGRPGYQGQYQGQGMMYGQGQGWNQGPQGQNFANPGQKGGWNRHHMMGGRSSGFAGRHHAMGGRGGFAGQRGMWGNVEIPQEIRDKQTEMGKLSIEMRNEMWKKPMERAKVEELYKKRTALRNELSEWRMKTRLDMIEKLQK